MLEENFFRCPYCGERISMLLDLSVEVQRYVEDCEVCCRPIHLHYEASEDGIANFEAGREME